MNEILNKEMFGKYMELLEKWQQKINLVSDGSVGAAWIRHFEDSLSLYEFIKDHRSEKIFDIGSGAGFPGMALAIAGIQNMTLVEADNRKCIFLEEVRRVYNINVEIINERVEELVVDGGVGCIIGRAFAPLNKFLKLCERLIGDETITYLLKGQNINNEIKIAKKNWDFNHILHDKNGGYVLKINNIKKNPY